MSQRLLSNVFSGFISGVAGGLAGEQAAKERALQLAEMRRRQAMQEEDQAMQRFQFGAQVEDRARQDALGPYDDAIRGSDPNAEGYGALWDQRAQAEQGLGARRFGPGSLPFIFGGGGQTAPPTAGGSTVFGVGMQPLPNAIPGQGQPTPIPNHAPGTERSQLLSAPRPVRLDPKAERAKAALLDQWKTLYSDVVQVDRDTAMELGNLIRRVNAGEFKDLAEAEALAAPIIAKSKSKFQLQDQRLRDKEAADDAYRKKQLELTEAERLRVEAARKATDADRDEARAAKAETDARNYDLKLNDDLLAAKKTGNAAAVRRILDQRSLHAKQFPKIISVDPEYSDEAMEIRRTRPVFRGIPNTLGEEEVWETETPEEVRFRKSRYLASLLEDPTARAKADKDALKDLWGVFKSERWKSLSPDTRASIIDQIGEYGSKLYGVKDLFPPSLKDVNLTPAEIESKRRWDIANARAAEDQRMQRESHAKNLALAEKRLEEANQKLQGIYKPGGDKNNSGYFVIQTAIQDLKEARDAYKEAMKSPEAGYRDKTTARWAQEVNERRAHLDAVIANPQGEVQRIQQEQGMDAPPPKRPAAPQTPIQPRRDGKQKYFRSDGSYLFLTPAQAKALGY